MSWKSSKQPTTADSTTEAEYIVASDVAKEAIWLKKFIRDLGIIPKISNPIPLLCEHNGGNSTSKRAKVSSEV